MSKRYEFRVTPGELNFLEVAVDTLLEQQRDILKDALTMKQVETQRLIERIEDGESLNDLFKKVRTVNLK